MQTACSSSGTKPAQLTRSSRNRNQPHPSTPAQGKQHPCCRHYLFNIVSVQHSSGSAGGRPGISTPDKVEAPRGAAAATGTGSRNRAGGANHPCSFQLRHSVHISVCGMLGNGINTTLEASRDPAGCLASHSRAERDNDPLLGGICGRAGRTVALPASYLSHDHHDQ